MINVLSLFDGLGGARIALDQLGIECNYYASEVDKYAIKVAMANYPDIIQLGDVRDVTAADLPNIDLIIGGSPCQDLSVAKTNRKGLEGEKSKLFWEYVRLKKALKPKHFILENVSGMPKESTAIIRKELGTVSPIKINSALVTAQNRERFYWTNTGVWLQPVDKGIVLADIIEHGVVDRNKSFCIDASYHKGSNKGKSYINNRRRQIVFLNEEQIERVKRLKGAKVKKRIKNGFEYDFKEDAIKFPQDLNDKAQCLTTSCGANTRGTTYIKYDNGIRKLTPRECERLQGIPDDYTNHVSNSQRYKMVANGYTIPVIKYILSHADF